MDYALDMSKCYQTFQEQNQIHLQFIIFIAQRIRYPVKCHNIIHNGEYVYNIKINYLIGIYLSLKRQTEMDFLMVLIYQKIAA